MTHDPEGGLLSSLKVIELSEEIDVSTFDCGEPDLTGYLCDGDAASDELAAFSRCYLVLTDGDALVGYFAVLADSIRLAGKERPEGVSYSTAPGIKLGRMGVHREFRSRHVGVWILDYVVGMARSVSDHVGVRYVTLDALDKEPLVKWYSAYGFVRNHGERERGLAVFKWFRKNDKYAPGHVSMRFDILLEEELEE